MVRAVRVHSLPAGNFAVQYDDVRIPPPPEFQVEIRHTDIVASSYDQRAKDGDLQCYPMSSVNYPFILGLSGVGIVTEVGSGVLDYQIGHRVCYVSAHEPGSFSEQRVIPAKNLVVLPAFLSSEEAASVLFEGLLAWMVLKRVCSLRKGDRVLIHGINKGLGSLLSQWAKVCGAVVIGTVDEGDTTNGANINLDHVIPFPSFEKKVLEITDGAGVAAVFHVIDRDLINSSLDCISSNGILVVLGEMGGLSIPAVTELVREKGTNVTAAFPLLWEVIARREDLLAATTELFSLIESRALSFSVKDKYPLQLAAQALASLANQKQLGSVILLPPIPDPREIPDDS